MAMAMKGPVHIQFAPFSKTTGRPLNITHILLPSETMARGGPPSPRRFLWREALCAPGVYPPDLVLERGVDEAVALEGV